ncbi:exosortase P [Actinosynnema sp. NPDC053489]|uniref:exosortase P n=1 Tax=Actinosynnema sp. NPDC053489 TaxID=3363916 RepID=UPI0037C6C9FF
MALALSRPERLNRVVVVALALAAIGLVLAHRAYRTAEVVLSGLVLRALGTDGVEVVASRQTVYFGLGSDAPLGLRMTPECTSVFLVVPLLVVGAVMTALRPRIARRVLLALAVAGAAVVLVNQARVVVLVRLVGWLGVDTGYHWGHTLLGSLVSVFGGAAALVAFVWLATRS